MAQKYIKQGKVYFELEMECRALLLVFKDSGEVNVGKAKIYVDGEYHLRLIHISITGSTAMR